MYVQDIVYEGLISPGVGQHGHKIDIPVNDDQDGSRRCCVVRHCGIFGGEKIVLGVEDMIAKLAIQFSSYHLRSAIVRASNDRDCA